MLSPLLTSLRPRQWSKNLFVLAPLAFSQQLREPEATVRGLLAFAVFSAAASSVYLVNDCIDRPRDRLHPLKRRRPLAAGTLSVTRAMSAATTLALAAFVGAWWLSSRFTLLLAIYLGVNGLYSLLLKNVVILDVLTVSSGFVVRVAAGAAAVDAEVSTWLLLCTIFLALLLAFSKRRHELLLLQDSAIDQRQVLAQYSPSFLDQMINVVAASTVMSYALYAVAPETFEKFQTGALIYTLPFVLFGIFRYLYLVYQVENDANPTEAFLRDIPSVVNILLWIGAVTAVIYRP